MLDTLGCLLIEASEASGFQASLSGSSPLSKVSASASTSAAVTARPLASRSLGGKPLIDWVLRRASEAEQLQAIVVILPRVDGLDEFKSGLPSGVTVFESDGPDGLARICDGLSKFPADGVVNLRLDCPLLDPCLIDRLVSSARSGDAVDYATFHSRQNKSEGRLTTLLNARLGLFAEYYRADVLRQLNQQIRGTENRENFSRYLCAHPEDFSLRFVSLPRGLDREDLRFSLRHQDDWDHAEQIVEAIDEDDLDWQHMVSLLEGQPRLLSRMADLNKADLKAAIS